MGLGQSRQAARLPCLWAGLPGLKWKPFFFGANCGHKETKNMLKKKKQSHVGNLYSKHPSMMYFPKFAINEIYKDQANVYRYSKYTRPMDDGVGIFLGHVDPFRGLLEEEN